MRYVASKDKKAVIGDLKAIYRATTARAAEHALEKFAGTWNHKYPSIARQRRNTAPHIVAMLDCPDEITKIIYTTNAIESLNSVVRKSICTRTIFPSDQSALKIVYLAIKQASAKWNKPLIHWHPAMNRFACSGQVETDTVLLRKLFNQSFLKKQKNIKFTQKNNSIIC